MSAVEWGAFVWMLLCVLLTGALGGRSLGSLWSRYLGPRVFPSLYGWVGPAEVVFGGIWPHGLVCFFLGHRWTAMHTTEGFYDDASVVWRECDRCARVEEPAARLTGVQPEGEGHDG